VHLVLKRLVFLAEHFAPSVTLSINKDKLLKLCDEYPLLCQRLLSAFLTKTKMMQCLVNGL